MKTLGMTVLSPSGGIESSAEMLQLNTQHWQKKFKKTLAFYYESNFIKHLKVYLLNNLAASASVGQKMHQG